MRGRMRAAATCVVMLLLLEGLLVGIAEGRWSLEDILGYSQENDLYSLEDRLGYSDENDLYSLEDRLGYSDENDFYSLEDRLGYSDENDLYSLEDGRFVHKVSRRPMIPIVRPSPKVPFLQPGVVQAQYGYGKGPNFLDGSISAVVGSHRFSPQPINSDVQHGSVLSPTLSQPQLLTNKGFLPVRSKRNVKRSYKASQQVVQVPQQVVQESAPYGSEQGKIDSGLWGSIQDGNGGYPGVSTGVEPVFPVGGLPPHEVGAGVVPELEGAVGDKDKESSGSSIGGWFREGWRRFSGAVENLGDHAEDTFRGLGKEVAHTAGRVHETISSAVDKLHQKYDELRKRLPQILERFKALILKFGVVIQEGARYCLIRFEHSVDQVRESQVIEKLEQKLKEGHAEVATFFQILGEKVQAWREQHGSAHVDAGLLDGYTAGSGQTQQEGGVLRQDIEEMPDFFQDRQVIVQLDKLKEDGVLSDSDIIILTQEHVTPIQQNQHQPQQQSQHQQQSQQGHYNQQQSQNTGEFIQFPE